MAFSSLVLPAEAASASKKLTLASYTLSITAPKSPATTCDFGSQLNCGFVSIQVAFAGLDGRDRPTRPGPPNGALNGTVHVVRIYGCQDLATGKRLGRYNTRVEEDAVLETRNSLGYSIPDTGDSLSVSVYAFLQDKQPGNCPVGSRAMTYRIKAAHATLNLRSTWVPVPSAEYSTPGRAQWNGAVPAPSGVA